MTLVILAAGLSNRFGGLKQVEPIDDDNCFIIDYSIYDAIKAGFNKIVFVINRENEDVFRKTVGNRISNVVKVEYAYQDNEQLKRIVDIPVSRVKPFGTAHALYCAKNYIDGPFGVISADDFYGPSSFVKLYDSLKSNECCTIGYEIASTISKNGSVKRGVCFTKDGYLQENMECELRKNNDEFIGKSLVDGTIRKFKKKDYVSMLMYGLDYSVMDYMNKDILKFLDKNKNNLENCEYFLPTVLTNMIKEKVIKIKLVPTEEKWMGITYKEDLDDVKKYIEYLKKQNVYPRKLYDKVND